MRKIMPDVVESQPLSTLSPEDTVIDAVTLMRDRRIGAILVTNDQALVGIITERDIVFRVVAATRDPETTRIAEVMTTDPDVVAPGADVMTALERMQSGGYRHLPVVDGGALVGIVSIRDIYASVRAELEEAVIERDAYLTSTLDD
ncbi:MAG: CBS domain-containing protein [Alphaproteobacteria bacterium]|jgi:CBS domain-containing protein|nr:CBS domain-containing protein [Alphaproteobacteria bacterium]